MTMDDTMSYKSQPEAGVTGPTKPNSLVYLKGYYLVQLVKTRSGWPYNRSSRYKDMFDCMGA